MGTPAHAYDFKIVKHGVKYTDESYPVNSAIRTLFSLRCSNVSFLADSKCCPLNNLMHMRRNPTWRT